MTDTETEVMIPPEREVEATTETADTPAPDQFDAMSDDDLRAFIKDRDGKSPHPRTGRDKLLKSARGDAASSAEIEAPDATDEPTSEGEEAPAAEVVAQAEEDQPQPEPAPVSSPAAASAALDAVELRVAELVAYLKGELHHFEDGVDGVCKLIAERLKAAL